MKDGIISVLGIARTIPARFEIIILLIKFNAYFRYGKKVFRMLYSRILLLMYFNVFIRRAHYAIERNVFGCDKGLPLGPELMSGRLGSGTYNILKL
jgi:hypothetical protein